LPAPTGDKSGSAVAAGVFVPGTVAGVAAAVQVGKGARLAAKFGFTAAAPVRALLEITAVGWVLEKVEFEETGRPMKIAASQVIRVFAEVGRVSVTAPVARQIPKALVTISPTYVPPLGAAINRAAASEPTEIAADPNF